MPTMAFFNGLLASTNELGSGNPLAEHVAVLLLQLAKIALEKIGRARRRIERKPFLGQLIHQGVVLLLRMAVRITPTGMTPQVAVEIWADVPQFVNDRRDLILERALQESRQVEAEQIELFPPVGIVQPLDRPGAPAAVREQLAPLEPQRGERSLDAVPHRAPRLTKTNRHPPHVDVRKLGQADRQVVAQPPHVQREVETLTRFEVRAVRLVHAWQSLRTILHGVLSLHVRKKGDQSGRYGTTQKFYGFSAITDSHKSAVRLPTTGSGAPAE